MFGGITLKYRRRLKYYFIRLFRLKDSPKAVAGGAAFGLLTHFYPTFGFGPLFAVAMAGLFRTNIVAATLAWAVFMPLFPILFYLNFLMGDFLIGVPTKHIAYALHGMAHIRFWDIMKVGQAFFLGALVNGTIEVIIIWWLGAKFLNKHRKDALGLIKRIL